MLAYSRPVRKLEGKFPLLMRSSLNASDRLVRCQPLVSDSEASHFANKCEQVWREMSRKTAPKRYFTTGDIADYTGLTQGQISKTATDPNSWLALFVVCAGNGEHCRFVDPTGWLLGLWCGFERVKRSFPGATRNRWFKAFRIIGLEKGEPRRRYDGLSAVKSRAITQQVASSPVIALGVSKPPFGRDLG